MEGRVGDLAVYCPRNTRPGQVEPIGFAGGEGRELLLHRDPLGRQLSHCRWDVLARPVGHTVAVLPTAEFEQFPRLLGSG